MVAIVLVPVVLVQRVLPTILLSKGFGALMSYHSFLVIGSATFFLPPLPFLEILLFFPKAISYLFYYIPSYQGFIKNSL